MHIHSDILRVGDLYNVAFAVRHADGRDFQIIDAEEKGSRSRARALKMHGGSLHGRYALNNSNSANRDYRAADWETWGYFIARLFWIDPMAKIGWYDGIEDFRQKVETWSGKPRGERKFLELV